MELNPVRAKMVEDPENYTWSSYNVCAHGKRDVFVYEHSVYLQMSEVEEERRKYQQLVQGMLKEKNAMKGQIEWRVVYGGEDFVKDMATSYNITEKIKRMGR